VGIVSFAFIALAFVIWLTVGSFIGTNPLLSDILALTLFAAVFAFLIGCALFGVDVAWALTQVVLLRFLPDKTFRRTTE
jgi:hypothetical protein